MAIYQKIESYASLNETELEAADKVLAIVCKLLLSTIPGFE